MILTILNFNDMNLNFIFQIKYFNCRLLVLHNLIIELIN